VWSGAGAFRKRCGGQFIRVGGRLYAMKKRDAVLMFRCFQPDFVQVIETVDGSITYHQNAHRSPEVVTRMEKKYMFFGDQADLARKQVMQGHSCEFNVYFREP
jgi:hypothetical protein